MKQLLHFDVLIYLYLFFYYSLVMTSKGEWVVGDTLDTDGLNNEDYKSKYQQQLGRRKWLEENQRPRKGEVLHLLMAGKETSSQSKS